MIMTNNGILSPVPDLNLCQVIEHGNVGKRRHFITVGLDHKKLW